MAHVLKTPNPFDLEKARLGVLLDAVAARIGSRGFETEADLFRAVIQAYREAYAALSHPSFQAKPLHHFDVRTPELFNRDFLAIETDLKALSVLGPQLSQVVHAGFNYSSACEERVRDEVKRGAGRSIDLQIISGSLRKDLIIAGDDFHDASKLDLEIDADPCEPSPFGGYLTLRRIGSHDLAQDLSNVRVKVEGPEGLYEGCLFGFPSQVQPEGGRIEFRVSSGTLSETKIAGVNPELQSRFETLNAWLARNPAKQAELGVGASIQAKDGLERSRSQGSFGGLTRDEWEQLAGNFHFERSFTQTIGAHPFDENADNPESGFKIELIPAKESEKAGARLQMLDREADTYWQAELSYDTSNEFNRVKLSDDGSVGAVPERSYDEIRAAVQTRFDPRDLEITLTVDLGTLSPVNYLTIHPYLPDPSCGPEIVSLYVSSDGASFTEIEEIKDGRFEIKLTDGVNTELTETERVLALAPNSASYHGQGILAFEPRLVRFLRLTFRERSPIPAPYQVLRFLLTRTVTTTVKIDGGWFGRDKTRTSTERFSKFVDLDYLQTLYLLRGVEGGTAGETAPATSSDPSLIFQEGKDPFALRFSPELLLGSVTGSSERLSGAADVFKKIFGGRRRTSVRDTGWQATSQELVTRFDRARYVIGLRELGIYRYEYAERGELRSVNFRTPKPISQIALEADVVIPEGTAIAFYVSVDDGKSWNPIRALGSAASPVPQIYHVNSLVSPEQRLGNVGYIDLDGNPTTQCRLRAVLTRGESAVVSPVLKGYRLLLNVDGGLRS